MAAPLPLSAEDMLRVNGSRRFAAAMAAASPFASLADALLAARRIWLDEVDVNGWLEAFAAHPAIGTTSPSVSKWSKEEQSAALSTAVEQGGAISSALHSHGLDGPGASRVECQIQGEVWLRLHDLRFWEDCS